MIGALELLEGSGLTAPGLSTWGAALPSTRPGVYVIEFESPPSQPPFDLARIDAWLEYVPELRLYGLRPKSLEVAEALARWWWPQSRVAYIGCTVRQTLATRVRQFVKHQLGDQRPHRGGQWLKTFAPTVELQVWWAETSAAEAEDTETRLLGHFRSALIALDPTMAQRPMVETLPFANLQTGSGAIKPHGLTGQVRTR